MKIMAKAQWRHQRNGIMAMASKWRISGVWHNINGENENNGSNNNRNHETIMKMKYGNMK
jgi:hypothetical protein